MGQTRDFTLRVEVPVVTVDVSVTTLDGQPVDGLEPDDFVILDNGEPQDPRYFGTARTPWHMYLLLDTSASTESQHSFIEGATERFLQGVREQDEVAIGVFGDETETLVGWDTTRDQALGLLRDWRERGVRGQGTTGFYEALSQVVEREFGDSGERRAVIVITDGRDVSLYRTIQEQRLLPPPETDHSFQKVLETVLRSGIPLYFVALNTDQNLSADGGNEYRSLQTMYPGSAVGERYLEQVRIRMERLAGATGGDVFLPRVATEVEPYLGEIVGVLGQAYSIGWVRPLTDEHGFLRTIQIHVKGHPEYRVRPSRTVYMP